MSLAITRKQPPGNTQKPKRGDGHGSLKSPHTSNPNHSAAVIQCLSNCPCGGGCPHCRGVIQPKLIIGRSNDKYEQEADRVAEQIMRLPEHPIQIFWGRTTVKHCN